MDTKTALRSKMRALRRELAEATPDAGARAAANLPANWPAHAIESYGLYHPVGSELDPTQIRLPTGRRALPVVIDRDAALIFRLHELGEAMAPDALGIAAPTVDAPEVLPDVIFAPVLAFDRGGGRLGQGGGHYDRTIASLRAVKPVLVVGVAYAGQELPGIPMEPHDQPLNAILTETAFFVVARET